MKQKPKTSAHYQREYRQRLREQGLVKKEVWIRPDNASLLSSYEKQLRLPSGPTASEGVTQVTMNTFAPWTTTSLYEALSKTEHIRNGRATIDLIDGVEPVLQVTMKEYGDLPLFLTVAGEQILAEAALWSVSEVADIQGFNDAILRTHKYFPLSTISLDSMGGCGDYYHMFGALSATSTLENVVFEIEVLATNVIQATEAYGEFLVSPVAAV